MHVGFVITIPVAVLCPQRIAAINVSGALTLGILLGFGNHKLAQRQGNNDKRQHRLGCSEHDPHHRDTGSAHNRQLTVIGQCSQANQTTYQCRNGNELIDTSRRGQQNKIKRFRDLVIAFKLLQLRHKGKDGVQPHHDQQHHQYGKEHCFGNVPVE